MRGLERRVAGAAGGLAEGVELELLGGLVGAGIGVVVDAFVHVWVEALASAGNQTLIHEDLVVVDGGAETRTAPRRVARSLLGVLEW